MKTYWEKKFIREVILASAIVVLPFFLYLHTLFADNQDYLTIFGVTLNHNRGTSSLYAYSVLVPLINLLFAFAWFFTNRFWWRKFILIPIGLFLYQLAKIHLYFDGVYGNTDFFIAIMITSLSILIMHNIAILIDKKALNEKGKISYSTSVTRYDFNRLKMIYSDLKNQITKLNENKLGRPQLSLLQNLYHLKLIFEKNFNYKLKSQETASLIPDYAIVFLLLLLPIVSYSFKIVPDGVQILKFGNITLTNNGFIDVGYFIWFCALKFCSILPLIIWFVTSGAWWRYALFSPIIIFSYQLRAAIVNISPNIDENEYATALPFVIVLVLVLIFLSKLIKYQSKIMDLYEGVTLEINQLLNHPDLQSELYRKSKAEFEQLKNNGDSRKMASANIGQLLDLRKQLSEQIKE